MKETTHIVIKKTWIEDYINEAEDTKSVHTRKAIVEELGKLIGFICNNKPVHNYIVVNRDESYAKEIQELILTREDK